jgi:amino acid transporter
MKLKSEKMIITLLKIIPIIILIIIIYIVEHNNKIREQKFTELENMKITASDQELVEIEKQIENLNW